MRKTSPFSQRQRKKIFLALCIKLCIVTAIPLVYLFSTSGLDGSLHVLEQETGDVHRSRNILGFNDAITESPNQNKLHPTTQSPENSTKHAPNCTKPAILELPSDGFTREQRQNGWIAIHIALACYCFWLIATICDDYFVPAIEGICSGFNLNEDVVGGTFMAAAASSSELFINVVGTFVTKSDLGVGTIVGSAVFNILAVPACCGLFARKVVYLDWWPISRDCSIYALSVVVLIVTIQDGVVMWYEALALVLTYLVYIAVMYWNDIMSQKARTIVAKIRRQSRVRPYRERAEITPLLAKVSSNGSTNGLANGNGHANGNGYTNGLNGVANGKSHETSINIQHRLYPIIETYEADIADTPYQIPHDMNACVYLLKWPITFILWISLPDCRKHPKLKMITFFMCIVWIGVASYAVAMVITIIGDTMNIPDSVMGLTFLAAGTSLPEAISSVIVTNQGHGAMGISSSISSNTFDILLCLGLPWFFKSFFQPEVDGEYWITLHSNGITYSTISLLTTLAALYGSLALNRFKMDWKIGLTCLVMYLAFVAFASMIELNVFFQVNLPTCSY